MPTIAIWKSKGPTSHDVVDAVRRIAGERRVGHAGTLDPCAEGVLVIGIGREATRELKAIVGTEKEYVAIMRLGATSTTDDAEGEVTPTPSLRGAEGDVAISRRTIDETLPRFIGRLMQVPPAYSAVKLGGTPAYTLARSGRAPNLAPREVEIRTIDILRYEWPELEIRVVCGPGTYIRALARDIGRTLGTGGYLTALTRTRVGAFTNANALTIEQFRTQWPQIAAGR